MGTNPWRLVRGPVRDSRCICAQAEMHAGMQLKPAACARARDVGQTHSVQKDGEAAAATAPSCDCRHELQRFLQQLIKLRRLANALRSWGIPTKVGSGQMPGGGLQQGYSSNCALWGFGRFGRGYNSGILPHVRQKSLVATWLPADCRAVEADRCGIGHDAPCGMPRTGKACV